MVSTLISVSSSAMLLLIVAAVVSSVLLLNVSAASTSSPTSPSSSLQKLSSGLTSIYFIGDIHGDVGCAKEWVKKTNLINITSTPYTWIGNNQSNEAIVFMGDYVDKGSTSSSALLFVKELQTTFPDNVVTLLGNHDFFLMMDTALQYNDNNDKHPLGHPHHDYTYAFMHPEEYIESNFTKNRDDDEEILEYILSGLSYVYDHNLVNSLHMCSPNCIGIGNDDAVNNMFDIIPPFNNNHTLKERVLERLETWRNEYAYGLYDSDILQWMTQQPIVAVVGDALIVHGGVSAKIITYLDSSQTRTTLEDFMQEVVNNRLNRFFQKQFERKDINGPNQIESHLFSESDIPFELVLDYIQHRGYFHQSDGCKDVNTVLDTLSQDTDRSINRVVVGHTPQQYATELCDGKLLATDSSLSRSFRTYGNMYCPLNLTSSTSSSSSSSNTYCGDTMKETCEGSISLLTRTSVNKKWPANVQQYQFNELPIIIKSHEDDEQSNDEL
jgi:hypothetical protein